MTDSWGFSDEPVQTPPALPAARLTAREWLFVAIGVILAVSTVVLAVLLAGATRSAYSAAVPSPSPTVSPNVALVLALPAGTPSPTEYSRSAFGQAWLDVDRNGCDTRNDILGRDLSDPVFKQGTRDCKVLSGTLDDPYTGKVIPFVSGETTSDEVQIDHIVPLSWAWANGAWAWSLEEREHFANDPANLLAVDGGENMSKSDKGPAAWLPADGAYWCDYVTKFVTLVDVYDLTISEADRAMSIGVLSRC